MLRRQVASIQIYVKWMEEGDSRESSIGRCPLLDSSICQIYVLYLHRIWHECVEFNTK